MIMKDIILKHLNKMGETLEKSYGNKLILLDEKDFDSFADELVEKLNIDDVSKRSITDNYEREKYANEKSANEIKEFCEYVMHQQSDLHQDAKQWIDSRLK